MNPIILALATQRLTQLIVEDEITRPWRQRITKWGDRHPDLSMPERIATAVNCGACSSVWAAGAVLTASRVPVLRPALRVLAASQAALAGSAVIERISR